MIHVTQKHFETWIMTMSVFSTIYIEILDLDYLDDI